MLSRQLGAEILSFELGKLRMGGLINFVGAPKDHPAPAVNCGITAHVVAGFP